MEAKEIQKIFEKYTPLVDSEIKELLSAQENLLMYDMMSYFFGYLDEELRQTNNYGGKRFRPGITLLLSDFYGHLRGAIPVASAIEIFHNFTLIHDDITDHDDYRRGRETVWKKWGISHGINTGDAQLILTGIEMQKLLDKNAVLGSEIQKYLNQRYLEIAEGQFLDFNLSELPLTSEKVSKESTLDMIGRKSGVLVGASSVVAGMLAGKGQQELDALWDYGYNLGLTYQLCDDIVSIWGKKAKTGKDELADIREKKKTMPVIFARDNSEQGAAARLSELYQKQGLLTPQEVAEAKSIIDLSGAKESSVKEARGCLEKVDQAIEVLNLSAEQKGILKRLNEALFADLYAGVTAC